MRPEFSALRFVIGSPEELERLAGAPAEEPFAPARVALLNEASRAILADPASRAYPDVVTFAFWIRRANLEGMKRRFLREGTLRLGRGVVFHIAPSNVPVNYAYSFAAGFLLGNANLVRLPSKEFPQAEIVNRALRRALEGSEYQGTQLFVRYPRSREINDYGSSICNVRVVWGGDATIRELRQSPLPPRAGEVTFADRASICVIDAETYRRDPSGIAEGFYNDTYLSDQNACTSPRLVCWMGEEAAVAEAREAFWRRLKEQVSRRYAFQPVQFVDKLTACCLAAAAVEGVRVLPSEDGEITRVELERLDPGIWACQGNSGFFYEYRLRDVLELAPLCDEKLQTVALLGDRSILLPLLKSGVRGIDRVTAIGHTMDFDLIWDGYDLTEQLTREVSL